ncbi:MAG: hypothetical protein LBQ01_08925 [Prevotellaceae bacterium]|jgi:hypothetical protein|nr:hypothetical protein [Prevotellaceae bacterium]
MKILLIDFVELKFGYADLKILSKKRGVVIETGIRSDGFHVTLPIRKVKKAVLIA